MSEYQPYTGTIPGCKMKMVRVKTKRLQHFNVLARFAKNIEGVTAWKDIRPLNCNPVFCGGKNEP